LVQINAYWMVVFGGWNKKVSLAAVSLYIYRRQKEDFK